MAKAKKKAAPRARFQTGATKVGGEFVESEAPVPASAQFSEVERFFIDNNPGKSDAEIAIEIAKPVSLVAEYRSQRSDKPVANRMLHRPAKGVVAMTEASSMASEDKDREWVSSIEIKRAIADGDLVKAAELQAKIKVQQADAEKKQKALYSDRVHYIR